MAVGIMLWYRRAVMAAPTPVASTSGNVAGAVIKEPEADDSPIRDTRHASVAPAPAPMSIEMSPVPAVQRKAEKPPFAPADDDAPSPDMPNARVVSSLPIATTPVAAVQRTRTDACVCCSRDHGRRGDDDGESPLVILVGGRQQVPMPPRVRASPCGRGASQPPRRSRRRKRP